MNNIESLKLGIKGLISNKLRTFLTMLGIVFGVAAVIAMLSIGEGARQETLQQIELLGTNNIIINRVNVIEPSRNAKASFSPGLTLKDAQAIKEINPYVEYITPQRETQGQITYKTNIFETKVVGTTPEYLETFNSRTILGRFFGQYHIEHNSNVCVIGSNIKNQLFRFEDPVGKKIKIDDLWFEIIGVVAPKNIASGSSSGFGIRDFNSDIYIPISTMMFKMDKVETDPAVITMRRGRVTVGGGMNDESVRVVDRNSIDQLTVKIINAEDLKEAAYLTQKILDRRHYGVKDFSVVLPEALLEQRQRTQRIFNVVMGAIAGISLLVGGIGIMNIMLANIMERTREIGVRRAVGATKMDVLTQFIYEAVMISILGGLTGIIVGFILTSLISTYANWSTIISTFSVILAFVVSVATGLIFGIYPAKKAADKNPIESLRYE